MPTITRKFLIATALSIGTAGSLAMGLITASTPARAQLSVFDPTNYTQNLLTAARTLTQINNQITSLQNEATMLINQAKNLSRIDFPQLQQLNQNLQAIDRLMGQAQGIDFRMHESVLGPWPFGLGPILAGSPAAASCGRSPRRAARRACRRSRTSAG